tara:strand:+ start:258 stop:833 length:576 start_codon:yes stop_codon:yes gene_type:complete
MMTKINLNKYAMEQRIAGKLLREIGEEMGVGVERARQRVAWGFRYEEKYERDKNATTMGDLFLSARLSNGIKNMDAKEMTFDEFLENVSQQKMIDTPNIGKSCVKELINALQQKRVSEEKISAWLNVKIKKIKKVKKKRCDAGIPNGPEEKFETCQQYVIHEGRAFMGSLCNQPLTSQQKKYCSIHRRGKK